MSEHHLIDYIQARLTAAGRFIDKNAWLDELSAIFPHWPREEMAKLLHIEMRKAGVSAL